MMLSPPLCTAADVDATLARQGFAVLSAATSAELLEVPPATWARRQEWIAFWDALPPDLFLRDGGRYRRRRHASLVLQGGTVTLAPHRPHWQPVEYNALHGGIQRHFEPVEAALLNHPLWQPWLLAMAQRASRLRGLDDDATWFVEAHPFRIDTSNGIGRPTPEGAHRDGVDLVSVTLLSREGLKGGETRVFGATSREGQRFTLSEPWSTLLLDDERVIHETTPIQPLDAAYTGHRDTLVLTFRQGGFQGPAAQPA
jgi:hypothetical protein